MKFILFIDAVLYVIQLSCVLVVGGFVGFVQWHDVGPWTGIWHGLVAAVITSVILAIVWFIWFGMTYRIRALYAIEYVHAHLAGGLITTEEAKPTIIELQERPFKTLLTALLSRLY